MTHTPRAALTALGCLLLAGCAVTVPGTAGWPGATLASAALGPGDFPPGVQYDRLAEQPGQPDGAGAPPAMPSRPAGCADALTNVIARSAERGPGSALKYVAAFDGARIMVTLVSWNLDMEGLQAEADRCARFEAYFDPDSEGIPITTAVLAGAGPGALAYQQTMTLGASASTVYMALENVGRHAVFAIAYPTPNPDLGAKATLPQTFLEVFARQAARLRSS